MAIGSYGEFSVCQNQTYKYPIGYSLIFAITAILLVITFPLLAANSALPSILETRGWEEITFDRIPQNRYADCGDGCIEVSTTSSASMIGKQISNDLMTLPILNWEWKIENPVTKTDLTLKGEDDRAIAIYITFPYDPDTATFSEKLLRPVFELFRGSDSPSRMLSYVWAGFGKPGDTFESPFFGGVNAMIIGENENSPIGQWQTQRVNVIADHKRAFGFAPRTTEHILISADSDDTGSSNRAWIRNIKFTAN